MHAIPQQQNTAVALRNALAAENQAEIGTVRIGTCASIDAVLPAGVRFQTYAAKFKAFAAEHPMPELLHGAESYAGAFASLFAEPEKADGAAIYVVWKIWQAKGESGNIFNAECARIWTEVQELKSKLTAVYQAAHRIVREAPEDSFAAGFGYNLKSFAETVGIVGHPEIASGALRLAAK